MSMLHGTRRALLGTVQRTYAQKVLGIAPANLVSYLPLWEASGSVALDQSGHGYNGAYTGVDLGQPGIGDGRTCPLWDGVNDYGNWLSAGLTAAFNKDEGTAALWAKVSAAGVWSDGVARTMLRLEASSSNYVWILKQAGVNSLLLRYDAGATVKGIAPTSSSTGWLHLALSWSKTADEVKVYLNGAQSGATLTGLGTWSGALTTGGIGSLDGASASSVWSGYLAHCTLWNTPLSAAQILAMATL